MSWNGLWIFIWSFVLLIKESIPLSYGAVKTSKNLSCSDLPCPPCVHVARILWEDGAQGMLVFHGTHQFVQNKYFTNKVYLLRFQSSGWGFLLLSFRGSSSVACSDAAIPLPHSTPLWGTASCSNCRWDYQVHGTEMFGQSMCFRAISKKDSGYNGL